MLVSGLGFMVRVSVRVSVRVGVSVGVRVEIRLRENNKIAG